MLSNRLIVRTSLALALAASFGASPVLADTAPAPATTLDAVSAKSPATAERAVREELHRALLRLAESGALGDRPDQVTLNLDEPAQHSSNLGVLVDSAQASNDGVHVLGVTPGSSAERMGVRAGDVLTAVNAQPLQGLGVDAARRPLAATTLRQTVDTLKDGESLRLAVLRDGQSLSLDAPQHTLYLPAMRLQLGAAALLTAAASVPEAGGGCGRISQFDVAPRQDNLHRAVIISIDGKLPGVHGQDSFAVPSGTHTVEVAEAIESRYLAFNERTRDAYRAYKKIDVDVAPDTTYLIAARLDPDKRNDPRAFWAPVMWKQNSEGCSH